MKRWVAEGRAWALLLLLVGLLVSQSWVTYRIFTSRAPGGNDFFSRWSNGCALIWTGQNPYSDEVTLQTQIRMHGRRALPGEDLAAFSYPLYALYFFWPLCYVRPYALVQAIWMTLMLYGVVAGTLLMMRASRWRPSTWLWGVTLIWAVVNYPHARAVLLGQMVIIVFIAVGLVFLALRRRADFWAGAALAASTIKPQVVFLLVIWLLWWAAWQRRWRLWWGFGLTLALMGGVGLALVPTWPLDFVDDVLNYENVTNSPYHSLTWMVVRHFLGLGPAVEAAVTGLVVLYLLSEWWRNRCRTADAMLWVTGLTLNLAFFISVQVATTAYLVLLLPIFQLFRLVCHSAPRQAGWIILGTEGFLLVSQWAVFLSTIQGNFETAAAYLVFPCTLLVIQVMTRSKLTEDRPQ